MRSEFWGIRLLLFLSLALIAACGRVGPPQPPFIRIPEAVNDLAATQNGYDVILTWTNPSRYIDGSAATNLGNIQIRETEATLATVNVSAPGRPQSYALPVGQVLGRPHTFSVVVETTQGKLSQVSNNAYVTPVEVPGRVRDLEAIPDQRRIFLQWNKPLEGPEFADVYIVTRSDSPADSQILTETRFEDLRYQPGKSFTYNVTAARRVEGNLVIGIGPESKTIVAEDKTPPAVPQGLDITRSDTGAILTWDANIETDLAGYHVFRSERPDTGFKAISDRLVVTNRFTDASFRPDFYYAVSAVDEFQNESALSPAFRAP